MDALFNDIHFFIPRFPFQLDVFVFFLHCWKQLFTIKLIAKTNDIKFEVKS